jgi:hypothetical protein
MSRVYREVPDLANAALPVAKPQMKSFESFPVLAILWLGRWRSFLHCCKSKQLYTTQQKSSWRKSRLRDLQSNPEECPGFRRNGDKRLTFAVALSPALRTPENRRRRIASCLYTIHVSSVVGGPGMCFHRLAFLTSLSPVSRSQMFQIQIGSWHHSLQTKTSNTSSTATVYGGFPLTQFLLSPLFSIHHRDHCCQ